MMIRRHIVGDVGKGLKLVGFIENVVRTGGAHNHFFGSDGTRYLQRVHWVCGADADSPSRNNPHCFRDGSVVIDAEGYSTVVEFELFGEITYARCCPGIHPVMVPSRCENRSNAPVAPIVTPAPLTFTTSVMISAPVPGSFPVWILSFP